MALFKFKKGSWVYWVQTADTSHFMQLNVNLC